jgi:hypothetical protein
MEKTSWTDFIMPCRAVPCRAICHIFLVLAKKCVEKDSLYGISCFMTWIVVALDKRVDDELAALPVDIQARVVFLR